MENGKKEKEMDTEYLLGPMEKDTKDTIVLMLRMGMGSIGLLVEIFIMGHILMEINTDMGG